ncbi:PLP-dependent aminotransferase family protein [Alcaligenaceae bacterium SJ-26]|nr:PLP-dependent aminotransferase family protein [Alcaligenaceae bacterium SJ-26]
MGQFKKPHHCTPGPTGAGRRIYHMLREQIMDGTLAASTDMPSSRALATELGVSRTTITAVYDQLAAEGFILTAIGRTARVAPRPGLPGMTAMAQQQRHGAMPSLSRWGRHVSDLDAVALPHHKPARYDFLYGALASRDFPLQAWKRAYQEALRDQRHNLYYAPPEGEPSLLHALQGYLRRARGIVCDVSQILVVQGSQQAIDLCARLLLDNSDTFVIEDPCYLMARHSFAATGARMQAVAVDGLGLSTDLLPSDRQARLAYVTPSHQFPLGSVLPVSRRQALLHWARQENAWIIEDDYDGEFRYGQHPIDALHSMDTDGRVIYAGTVSKVLSPQLRLGYLVLPQSLVPVFRQAKRLTDRHVPTLEQQALATLISDGTYERHVRRMRRMHERRRTALLDAVAHHLPASTWVEGTAAGLHIVLWLPLLNAGDEAALAAAARDSDVGVYPVSPLFAVSASQDRPAGLILGYAGLTTEDIAAGMIILAEVLSGFTGRSSGSL